jgi:hypothetical protein
MLKSDSYKPRFSFEVTEAQFIRARLLLSSHGVKRAIFSAILDEVLDKVELHGEKFIIALSAKVASPTQLLNALKEAGELTEKLEGSDGQP